MIKHIVMDACKEINESYTLAEAVKEAQRCLRCKVPQCKAACPISNEIPDWIHELKMGNFGNAIHIIRSKSNLPAVCGRVCAHERQCEGACVLNKTGKHINIGKLERFVADFDAEAGLTHFDILPKTRGKIAVIGAGPSGITVAGDLSRNGFQVDVFEIESQAGGMLMYGIPDYRLPKDVVLREAKHLEVLGVNFLFNRHIGIDFTIDDLLEKGYDAVFLGIGSGKPRVLDIPVTKSGSTETSNSPDCKDVILATHFLRKVQLCHEGLIEREELNINDGDKVLVIGCGNTAIDAARSAVRIGARTVDIVYHRDIDRMAALRSEYEEALSEGVRFNWNASVVEVHTDSNDNMYEAVVEIKDGDNVTRTVFPAHKILMAVGARPSTRIPNTTHGIEVDEKGFIITQQMPYGMTTRKGVFAGGDVANRQATVVHAMADAKKVAEGIIQYVDAIKLMKIIEGSNS